MPMMLPSESPAAGVSLHDAHAHAHAHGRLRLSCDCRCGPGNWANEVHWRHRIRQVTQSRAILNLTEARGIASLTWSWTHGSLQSFSQAIRTGQANGFGSCTRRPCVLPLGLMLHHVGFAEKSLNSGPELPPSAYQAQMTKSSQGHHPSFFAMFFHGMTKKRNPAAIFVSDAC